MNKNDLIKKLENLDLPEANLPSHQRRLKMALLNSGYWKERTSMSLLKKFAPVGAVAVIALLVVVGVNYFKSSSSVSVNNLSLTPAAYAKELVSETKERLIKSKAVAGYVEPTSGLFQWQETDADGNIRDEKGRIIFITDQDGKLVPTPREVPAAAYTLTAESFLSFLEEAKQAKDLTYLGDKRVGDPAKPLSTVGRKIRILQFTDEKGNTAILGIDENNMPVVKIVYNDKGGVGGGVIFQQGEMKNGNQPVPSGASGEGVQYGKIDPNAPKPLDWEDHVKYWTENLEQPTDFNAIQK